MKLQTFIDRFEQYAPINYRYHNDPTGMQIGDRNAEIHKVMVTLDVRPEVVDEAIANHVDFIFAHHPVIFHKTQNLDFAKDPQLALYGKIIANHINVYAAHTNLDNAFNGMNDWLADLLGLTNVEPWLPNPGNPDVFMGRVGNLTEPMSMKEYAKQCKSTFDIGGLRLITPDLNRIVERVAVLGGDGGKFYREAQATGADVYITGDAYYHTMHDVLASDFSIIDPGHHIEVVCVAHLVDMFQQWSEENHWEIEIMPSVINTDPFTFI